jgi:hypothetical protein
MGNREKHHRLTRKEKIKASQERGYRFTGEKCEFCLGEMVTNSRIIWCENGCSGARKRVEK